jgi:hypothetical protein
LEGVCVLYWVVAQQGWLEFAGVVVGRQLQLQIEAPGSAAKNNR